MYAKITLVGNLGQDPEMRYVGDGTPVTNFSVACNRKWTNKDGSKGEQTTWFRCTAWRKTAETINQYLTKGRQVFIEGRLNPDENGSPRVFTRNDGTPGASYEVVVDRCFFLGSRGGNGASGSAPEDASEEAPVTEETEGIPF